MNRLWAPWRIKYVKKAGGSGKKCLFCRIAAEKRKDYVIFKTKSSISMLNTFPYNNGHMMVLPKRHMRDWTQLKDSEVLDLFLALNKTKRMLDKVLKPDGYNIGINISKSAGAGIAGHMHIHIVPRWRGDVNFMSSIYDTRVIPQSLDELSRRLKNVESKTN